MNSTARELHALDLGKHYLRHPTVLCPSALSQISKNKSCDKFGDRAYSVRLRQGAEHRGRDGACGGWGDSEASPSFEEMAINLGMISEAPSTQKHKQDYIDAIVCRDVSAVTRPTLKDDKRLVLNCSTLVKVSLTAQGEAPLPALDKMHSSCNSLPEDAGHTKKRRAGPPPEKKEYSRLMKNRRNSTKFRPTRRAANLRLTQTTLCFK